MKNNDLRHILTEQEQMSESFILSAFLAFSGGFQDAYTYIVRGHVFANAQTGNIVLMSTSFLQKNWLLGLRYLYPIFAFVLGVLIADAVDKKMNKASFLHCRQLILIFEICILFAVGFLPETLNVPANVLVSFSCAMQVQAFRTVGGGITYASTMCVGNLRGGTAALSDFLHSKNKSDLHRALYYFGVICIFALGAGIGAIASLHFSYRTVWACCAILLLALLLMDLDRSKNKKKKVKDEKKDKKELDHKL